MAPSHYLYQWILLIWTLGTNFSENLGKAHTFSFKEMDLKMSFGRRWPFCLGLNVLTAFGNTWLGQIYPPLEVYCQPTFLFSNIGWKAALHTSTQRAICSLRWHYQSDESPIQIIYGWLSAILSQITKFMGPTWGPPGSCWPQMGPMLAPLTLLSGVVLMSKKSFSVHVHFQQIPH